MSDGLTPALGTANRVAEPAGRRKIDFSEDEMGALFDCLSAALEKKAEDPAILDLRGISSVADFFVILTGNSQRQVQAISDEVEMAFRNRGARDYNVEGRGNCSWVLLDFANVVVHVFHRPARVFYAVENLWSDAGVVGPDVVLSWGLVGK